ncbi:hypothetical protein SDC9_106204 [bioreactor metagenome]|uniref:Nitrogen regulatory protein P-II n=1 Tax=bioreactor metagenome TaxID=1076179 RepID=A0A645BCD0_9ZZZZ
MDLYGLEATEKTVVMTITDAEKTKLLIKDLRESFYIDMPGNGIILEIHVKSVGGGNTLAFLFDNKIPDKSVPNMNFEYKMIVVILNESRTDRVMDAARKAGATRGTVLHAKGTGAKMTEYFYGVSLMNEKEVILIVAKTEEKNGDNARNNKLCRIRQPGGCNSFLASDMSGCRVTFPGRGLILIKNGRTEYILFFRFFCIMNTTGYAGSSKEL